MLLVYRAKMTGALVIAVLGLVCASTIANPVQPAQDPDLRIVGYYASWAVHRPLAGKFDVEQIIYGQYNYLIYANVGLGNDSKILVLDPDNDLEENGGKGAMKRFTGLKESSSYLNTLLAVGGWNEKPELYSEMASDPAKRRTFIDSLIPFLQQQGFDGIDFDFIPGPQDKQNFVLLLNELKAAFQPHNFTLSVALSGQISTLETAYDIPAIAAAVNFINVMSFDYHGAWEQFTGHHSALYSNPAIDLGDNSLLNLNTSIFYLIEHGADPWKLNLGIGMYGRGFLLEDPLENGLYANVTGPIPAGPYTGEAGLWGFNEICEAFHAEPGEWTVVHDTTSRATYAYKGRQWIGYDDLQSIYDKLAYMLDMGLNGFMMWSVDTDNGDCSAFGSGPVINAIASAVNAAR